MTCSLIIHNETSLGFGTIKYENKSITHKHIIRRIFKTLFPSTNLVSFHVHWTHFEQYAGNQDLDLKYVQYRTVALQT